MMLREFGVKGVKVQEVVSLEPEGMGMLEYRYDTLLTEIED